MNHLEQKLNTLEKARADLVRAECTLMRFMNLDRPILQVKERAEDLIRQTKADLFDQLRKRGSA